MKFEKENVAKDLPPSPLKSVVLSIKFGKENVAKGIFTLTALISVLAILLICGFLFGNVFPAIK